MAIAPAKSDTLKRVADPELKRFVREKWDLVEDHFAPAHCILFGSRVNGTPHEWSDIDVIIVSERFATIRFIRRAYEFKSVVRPHLGMTALCYTPAEFDNVRSGIGVVADACKEGIWLR
jgi:predicted nucleotidyltransferase